MAAPGTKIAIIFPLTGPRGQAKGLATVAHEQGWDVELYDVSPFGWEMLTEFQPALCFIGREAWTQMPASTWEGRRVIALHSDLTPLGIPSVYIDDAAVGAAAARHLLDKGLRSLAAVGLDHHEWSIERTNGFRAAAEAAGAACAVWGGQPAPDHGGRLGFDGLGPWLSALPKPLGVMACCDRWGQWVLRVCGAQGLRVPDEVAVVGVDNEELLCELSRPPLSSVSRPLYDLGVTAGRLATALLRGEPPPSKPIVIPPGAIAPRRSSDMLAVNDPDVALALRLIAGHASRPLTVARVLRQVPADRRRLERAFRQTVGRTMLSEIRRVHVEHAKRLLCGTDLPMPQVAARSGFANATLLGIAFRRETGLTPTRYRKQFRAPVCTERRTIASTSGT